MKFTPYLDPGTLELLKLRVTIHTACYRHSQHGESVVAHVYLRKLAESGPEIVARGLRFFAQTATRT